MAYRGHIPYSAQTDPKALFAQGIKNYLGGLNQQLESDRFGKAITEIDPEASLLQVIGQLLSQNVSPDRALQAAGMMSRNVTSPSQQISQKKLDHINMLQERVDAGTATAGQKASLDNMLEGQPLVRIGNQPWRAGIVGPGAMADEARIESDKKIRGEPLTETERKGVISVIQETVGEGKAMPFGIRRGAALKQEDMNKLWEDVAEATGHEGRLSTQQTQIEQAFDQYISMLNKGTGAGVLANQYEWDRSKYKKGQLKTDTAKLPTEAAKSPYKDYPDAFLEDGVWKVMQDGKKYRIED